MSGADRLFMIAVDHNKDETVMTMKALITCPILAWATAATPLMAAEKGDVQIKLLGTAVLPDGKITDIDNNAIGLPPGSQTSANDNLIPTVAIEYFLTDNFSLETICCLTQHDVDGRGAIAGGEAISNAKILPATLTAKYHMDLGKGFKPYIGAGPAYFIFIDEEPGATTAALGATSQRLNDKFGFALQLGADMQLGDDGFGLSIDAKRYFLRTTARWFDAGGNEILNTRHRIDPWVLSAGISYNF